MKILQISSAQSLGGGERHLADLVNGLTRRGHEVLVAVRPRSPLVGELENISRDHIVTLPLRNSFDAKSARDLARLVKENQIEIVHAHMARDYPPAAFAVRKAPAKLIVTRHVLFPLNPLHRFTLARAARVIAVSEAVATQLRQGIVRPEAISVVLNGINTDRFLKVRDSFDRSRFLADWKLPEESLLIGTVGELTPLKGQQEFLQAAVKILKRYPAARFIVAGIDHSAEGKHRKNLEQLIDQLGLKESVRLVGWLEDLAQLYCALDLFVSASHTESFGLVLAEAMASGTAIVATSTEGANEIIRPGETGILVPIGDADQMSEAIISLLADPDLRLRMGEVGQRTAVDRFGVERMVAETEGIYREVIVRN